VKNTTAVDGIYICVWCERGVSIYSIVRDSERERWQTRDMEIRNNKRIMKRVYAIEDAKANV